jgi:hypothetical protein
MRLGISAEDRGLLLASTSKSHFVSIHGCARPKDYLAARAHNSHIRTVPARTVVTKRMRPPSLATAWPCGSTFVRSELAWCKLDGKGFSVGGIRYEGTCLPSRLCYVLNKHLCRFRKANSQIHDSTRDSQYLARKVQAHVRKRPARAQLSSTTVLEYLNQPTA